MKQVELTLGGSISRQEVFANADLSEVVDLLLQRLNLKVIKETHHNHGDESYCTYLLVNEDLKLEPWVIEND